MEARKLEAGDVIIQKGKAVVVKKVSFERGRIVINTSEGRFTFAPNEEVEVE